jgi:hypothetical protein
MGETLVYESRVWRVGADWLVESRHHAMRTPQRHPGTVLDCTQEL